MTKRIHTHRGSLARMIATTCHSAKNLARIVTHYKLAFRIPVDRRCPEGRVLVGNSAVPRFLINFVHMPQSERKKRQFVFCLQNGEDSAPTTLVCSPALPRDRQCATTPVK